MKYRRGKSLLFILWTLMLAPVCRAERGYLIVQVKDIHKHPVQGVEVALEGSSEPGTSDRLGRIRIKLDSDAKVNDWVFLQIKLPPRTNLVLVSPWEPRVQVPPFENESTNYVPLTVATRGDLLLLKDENRVTAIAAKINKASSAKSKGPDPERQRREALASVANAFGLEPEEIDQAIRTLAARSENPYQRGMVALYEGNYPLASQELSKSLKGLEKEPVNPQAIGDAAFFLGVSLYYEGKYRESAAVFQKAQKMRPNDSTVLNNLALNLEEVGDYSRAESLLRQALEIDTKILGPDHMEVAKRLNNLATLLDRKGDYAGAEMLLHQAIEIHQQTLGPNHPDFGTDLNNLAIVLEAKGDFAGAEELFRRSLAIAEKALGPEDRGVSVPLSNLADLLRAKGDFLTAEPLYKRALAIDRKALGPNHPDVALVLGNLAQLLQAKGDLIGAEPLFRQALEIDEKALGADNPTVATQLNNLGLLLREKGDYAEAEALFRRVIASDEKNFGTENPDLGAPLNNLAGILEAKGDYAGAEELYRQSLAIAEKGLGSDHPNVAIDLCNLGALLYFTKHDYKSAEILFRRALLIREKAFGPDHPKVKELQTILARLAKEQAEAGQSK